MEWAVDFGAYFKIVMLMYTTPIFIIWHVVGNPIITSLIVCYPYLSILRLLILSIYFFRQKAKVSMRIVKRSKLLIKCFISKICFCTAIFC